MPALDLCMLLVAGVFSVCASLECYLPSPVYELSGAGLDDIDGIYVLLTEQAGTENSTSANAIGPVYARAYEKKSRTEVILLPSLVTPTVFR